MKNFVESGKTFDVILPADAAPGDVIAKGGLVGVLVNCGVAGDTVAAKRYGVFRYPKIAGALNQGDEVYLKSDENKLTGVETGNTLVGYAWADAAASDADVMFALKG